MASGLQLSCADYHIAWICALPDVELLPARLMLDKEHPAPQYDTRADDNSYIFGSIGSHTVVLATCPPGDTGNVNSARLAALLFRTFPNIYVTVLVGIGGGIPRPNVSNDPLQNVHLGDVVVGCPGDGKPACIYYDRGKLRCGGQFELVGAMANPDRRLANALSMVASDDEMGLTKFDEHMARLRHSKRREKFAHPGWEHDRLFKATYSHVGKDRSSCVECDPAELIHRPQRAEGDRDMLVFHRGRIAIMNKVIRDGVLRDEIGARCNGALCVEMEAAGIDVNRPCLVIRGICDYADSHKSDMWQSFAAGRAAVFARELLLRVPPAGAGELQTLLLTQIHGHAQESHIHNRLLAVGEYTDRASQPSKNSLHAYISDSNPVLDINGKVGGPPPIKMSIKTFEKLHLKKGVAQDSQANRFINKLASILKWLSVQQTEDSSLPSSAKKDLCGFENLSHLELKRLRSVLKSSHRVDLNSGAARFAVIGNGKLKQKRSMKVINVEGYEITIMFVERSISLAQHYRSRQTTGEKRIETIAKARIVPISGNGTVIMAHFHYIQEPDGMHCLNPVLSVGKILPLDSLVFRIVEDGDVDGLRHLLAKRRCSLQDRNIHGTPLLHYAMAQPAMCKFLIENGADIDELAPNRTWAFSNKPCLYPPLLIGGDGRWGYSQKVKYCKHLLLDAGADPTLMDEFGTDFFESAFASGATMDFVAHLLNTSRYIFAINDKDSEGYSLLLKLASVQAQRTWVDVCGLLLDREADIHAQDSEGRTCLHTLVLRIGWLPNDDFENEARALILLIMRGANVFTTDIQGRSIFEDAYECEHRIYWGVGSLKGDLWDYALVRCGLGEHIWSPRVYHYTNWYTEESFKSLWKGWEYLYPYTEGTERPCSGVILKESSEEGDEEDDEEDSQEDDEEDSQEDDEEDSQEDDEEDSQEDDEEDGEQGIEEDSEEDGEAYGGVKITGIIS